MDMLRFTDADAFYRTTGPFLLQQEAVNNLMISIVMRLADGSARWSDESPWLYAVADGDEMLACAVRTPPHLLVLTEQPRAVSAFLAQRLWESGLRMPGLLGPAATAAEFAGAWSAASGMPCRRMKAMRIYRCDSALPVTGVAGAPEIAGEERLPLLLSWMTAFNEATDSPSAGLEEQLRCQLAARQIQLWLAPHPVSMAAGAGSTPHGIRVSMVYTPPAERNRGYAAANVAALSRRLLAEGRQFCCLYTDLANPAANHLYRQIGYRPVCDVDDYRVFEEDAHA